MNKIVCVCIAGIFLLGLSHQSSAQTFQRAENNTWGFRISISNVGTVGNPGFAQGLGVSMHYPAKSGTEHLFEGGIWLGAKVNDGIRVSTSSVTSSSGYSIGSSGYEFTALDTISEQSRLKGEGFSDSDLITSFTDTNTVINNIQITDHETPLGAVVEMRLMSWFEGNNDNFVILEYKITNTGKEAWNDFYFGMRADMVVRNVKTANESGANFFNKSGYGYIDSLYTIYSFDAGSSDDPSTNTYGAFTILGSRVGDNFVHPLNEEYLLENGLEIPQINPGFWAFSGGSGNLVRPENDLDRYEKMSEPFPYEEEENRLRSDGQNANGNYISLISIGPYTQVEAGETVTVYVGASAVEKPSEFQGLEGKPKDTEASRLPLIETLQQQFKLMTGNNINDWEDNFIVPEVEVAFIGFNENPSDSTIEMAEFNWEVTGNPEMIHSFVITLSNEESEQSIHIDAGLTRFLIYNSFENDEISAFIETGLETIPLDSKLEEGVNHLSIIAADSEGNEVDKLEHNWVVKAKKQDILLIHDTFYRTSPIFSDLDYDTWDIGQFSSLSHESEDDIIIDNLKSHMSRWKGVIWTTADSRFIHLNHIPKISSTLRQKGGKIFLYGQLDQDTHELRDMFGISDIRTPEGLESGFVTFQESLIIPYNESYNLDTLNFPKNNIYSRLYRPVEEVDSLYGVNFNSRSIVGGTEEVGVYPVAWHYDEKNSGFMYLDLEGLENDENARNVINTIVNDILDIPSVVHTNTEGLSTENLHPHKVSLEQNYPNPFNPNTIIRFQLPLNSYVQLDIFDILGRKIFTLLNQQKPAGTYTINFDASKFSSGIYIYQLKAGNFTETKKMTLIK
ncbi:MAG: T9SS type A sorting domain-containing protein [Balneolaceae bacterium]